MRVLVTGATGAVGPDVVEALGVAGHSVRTLSLDPFKSRDDFGDIQSMVGDVTDRATVRGAMEGVEAVIHMAALLHIVNPNIRLKDKYEAINVGGTANILNAANQAGVERMIFFSTIAVYGSTNGQTLDEDSSVNPDSLYGKTKVAAEKLVLNDRKPDGRPIGVVLRLGAVYGPRIRGNYERLVHSLDLGWFIPVGDGSNRRTLIYSKDVARAAVLALDHPDAAGKIYNVSDGKFSTLREIISAICEGLGRHSPRFSLPLAPLRTAAGILEDGAKAFRLKSPIGRSTIDKYTEDIAVSSERIQSELGFQPYYDLRAGWKETIREMREAGAL